MHVKFEVRSFNRFKLVWLTGLLRTDTHRHTDTHRTKTVSPPFTPFTWCLAVLVSRYNVAALYRQARVASNDAPARSSINTSLIVDAMTSRQVRRRAPTAPAAFICTLHGLRISCRPLSIPDDTSRRAVSTTDSKPTVHTVSRNRNFWPFYKHKTHF